MITSLALLAALAVPAPAAQIRSVADLLFAPSHPADCAKMPQHKPFALVLTTKTPKVRMGSVPEFAVTITNCSGKALNLTASFPQAGPLDTSFHLYITDPEGKRVEPGSYHKFLPGEVYTGTSLILQRLGPGRAYTQPAYNLSWRYKFDKAGTYLIQVARKFPKESGGGVLKSNVITIAVTKRRAP